MNKRIGALLGAIAIASTAVVGFTLSDAAPAEAAGCATAYTYSATNQRCNQARHWNSGSFGTSYAAWVVKRSTSYQPYCSPGVKNYGSQAR